MRGWDELANLHNPLSHVPGSSKKKIANKKKSDEEASLSWSWICPSCVLNQGSALSGKKICIWWTSDRVYYRGEVQDYDDVSCCHRIAYEDLEWEFIFLGAEMVLYLDAVVEEDTKEVSSMNNKLKAEAALMEAKFSSIIDKGAKKNASESSTLVSYEELRIKKRKR
jgi:hypothetical protein